MRIARVQVHNYNSFNDCVPVELNEKLSLILGKNESGKTSFLRALGSFDANYKYAPEELCTYSKSRRDLDAKRLTPDNLEVISITFVVEPRDVSSLKAIHESLSGVKEFEITKHFSGRRVVSGDAYQKARDSLDREITAKWETTRREVAGFLSACKEGSVLHEKLAPIESQLTPLDPLKMKPELFATSLAIVQAALQALPVEGDLATKKTLLEASFKESSGEVAELVGKRMIRPSKVIEALPRFIYFSSVDQLEDKVLISALNKEPDKYKTLTNLLKLVNLDVTTLASADVYERRRMTRNASVFVTGLVNESWRQEKVQVNLAVDGDNLIISVEDDTGAIDPPSRRSQGFQYFLSFYVNLMVGSRGELQNTVLLLDDPGVYLHADGQKDLLATLEKLASTNQILVATHSPFLVDPQRLERILIAEKRPDGVGSSLTKDFHKSVFDALQAVRAAVGMTLGSSLFFNKTNFLIEGPSDRWILEGFATACSRANTTDFRLADAAFVAVGGAEKMSYFVQLLSIEGLSFACLLDHDTEGRKARSKLVEEFAVPAQRAITLAELCGAGADCEIEDLIDEEFYLAAVNRTYAAVVPAERQFPEITLELINPYPGLRVRKYERYSRENDFGSFDKEAVAREIHNMVTAEGFKLQDCPGARDRFTQLLKLLKLAVDTPRALPAKAP